LIYFIIIGVIVSALLWRRVFQMANETELECARIRFNALKIQTNMHSTYREEKEMLRRRFPYIVNGRFEDGTEVTEERMSAILADASSSVRAIRNRAALALWGR